MTSVDLLKTLTSKNVDKVFLSSTKSNTDCQINPLETLNRGCFSTILVNVIIFSQRKLLPIFGACLSTLKFRRARFLLYSQAALIVSSRAWNRCSSNANSVLQNHALFHEPRQLRLLIARFYFANQEPCRKRNLN